MHDQDLPALFQKAAPGYVERMGGRFISLDSTAGSCVVEFDIGRDYCHSVDVVQGGFVTAMLDIAMSHALFATGENVADVVNVSSLEIKTSFLEPTRAGLLRVEGNVIKRGYKTAFMEGRIHNAEGLLTATASTVAKIIRGK